MDTTTEEVTVGCFVSYGDMANPRRFGRVTAVDQHNPWSPYTVTWDDGEVSHSDLRQHGWRHETTACAAASRFGIPYARAGVDERGSYFVTCPLCETECHAGIRSADPTKEATRLYAEHFVTEHLPSPPCTPFTKAARR